jgi:Uma2 family endonuclease
MQQLEYDHEPPPKPLPREEMLKLPVRLPAGRIMAVNFPEKIYWDHFAEMHYEWVDGVLLKIPPTTLRHHDMRHFLRTMLDVYISLNPIGQVITAPFLMKLGRSYREPDIQLTTQKNLHRLSEYMLDGAADIAIELVIQESRATDLGDKFLEYEAAGVQEYWAIDCERDMSFFYRLQPSGQYAQMLPDSQGFYQTPILPKLKLHVPTLWLDELPHLIETVEMVKAMLQD